MTKFVVHAVKRMNTARRLSSLNHHHKIMAGLMLNLCCSICIVFLNKWLYSIVKFPNLTLTCIHFVATSIGLFFCKTLGVFSSKSLKIDDVFPLSVCFCGFVVFTNLSLQNNTVGTYQLAKVLTTPLIIVIQSVYYDTEYSWKIKVTLVSSTYFKMFARVFNNLIMQLLP